MVASYPQMPHLLKMGTVLVANYPPMSPSVTKGDNTGSTLSAIRKKGTILVVHFPQMTILVAHYPQMPWSVKMGQ